MTIGADQLVCRVMLKVEMLMARSELEQAVSVGKIAVAVRIHVLEWAADENVALADVRRGDGEPNERVCAWRDAAFDDAAEICGQILDAIDPVVLRRLGIDRSEERRV